MTQVELETEAVAPANPPVPPGIFGPPPLIEGEDESAYNELLAKVSRTVKPQDIHEEFWVQDIVNHSWDVLRWRRWKAIIISASMHRGVKTILAELGCLISSSSKQPEPNIFGECEPPDWDELPRRWMNRDPEARQEVAASLASAGLTMEAVRAQTLEHKLPEVKAIDFLTAKAEARRNAALREIEHYREGFAEKLREATQTFDAEYEKVPTQPTDE